MVAPMGRKVLARRIRFVDTNRTPAMGRLVGKAHGRKSLPDTRLLSRTLAIFLIRCG